MPRNIEIKARITSVDALEPMAASLATQGPTEIAQDDTFFSCKSGRLKLRMFSATERSSKPPTSICFLEAARLEVRYAG